MYRVEFSRDAAKSLRELSRGNPARAELIRRNITAVAADPFAPNNMLLPLTGAPNTYRLRIGDWRVLYRIERAAQVLHVLDIVRRGGAYR